MWAFNNPTWLEKGANVEREQKTSNRASLLFSSARMGLSTLGRKSVESLAVFLSQKGFQNEVVNCLEGMVVTFLNFLHIFGEFRLDSCFPTPVYKGCISMMTQSCALISTWRHSSLIAMVNKHLWVVEYSLCWSQCFESHSCPKVLPFSCKKVCFGCSALWVWSFGRENRYKVAPCCSFVDKRCTRN